MTVDVTTVGIGTTHWNLDRGYLASSDATSTIRDPRAVCPTVLPREAKTMTTSVAWITQIV
jgi:hypothetical protein